MIQNRYAKNKIIGITGGIASGKSTLSSILIEKGYLVIDADKVAREVVDIGKPAYLEIVRAFGEDILNTDKTINRRKLSDIIFDSLEKRLLLNNIVHPNVINEIISKIHHALESCRIIFVDIPLLIEEIEILKNHGLLFDEVWLVYADKETQLKRLVIRDNISEEQAIKRINAQMSIEEKKKYASKVIDNSMNLKELIEKTDELLSTL